MDSLQSILYFAVKLRPIAQAFLRASKFKPICGLSIIYYSTMPPPPRSRSPSQTYKTHVDAAMHAYSEDIQLELLLES